MLPDHLHIASLQHIALSIMAPDRSLFFTQLFAATEAYPPHIKITRIFLLL
jgi:hypothetical protein